MVSESIWQVLEGSTTPFGHGFTYSAHPVSAAAALANLEIYESENLVQRAAKTGNYLQERLRERLESHPLVGEIRGVGMVAAIELVANKRNKLSFDPKLAVQVRVYKEMQKRGVLVRPIPNSVAISPPLIFTEAEVDTLTDALGQSLNATADQLINEGHSVG
jgi:L-2,4-diaminobutyrate transaminase